MRSMTKMLASCAVAALGLAAATGARAETPCADLTKTALPHVKEVRALRF